MSFITAPFAKLKGPARVGAAVFTGGGSEALRAHHKATSLAEEKAFPTQKLGGEAVPKVTEDALNDLDPNRNRRKRAQLLTGGGGVRSTALTNRPTLLGG